MNWRLVGIIALILGILLRFGSMHWNAVVIHGDVNIDVSGAASLAQYGSLLDFGEAELTQPMPPEESGRPLAQHGPIWTGFGAVLTMISGVERMGDVYSMLSLLSFFSGLLVLGLSYLVGRKLLSGDGAWILVGWLSLSWLMIDYSGNGSLYSFQTALYLLWILFALHSDSQWKPIALGIISGVTYLLNFQAIILVPATCITLLARPSMATYSSSQPWKAALETLFFLIITFLVISPWLVRNQIVFGDPLYHHAINSIYVIQKGGFAHLLDEHMRIPLSNWLHIIVGSVTVWLPNNLYYAARKLMILAPVAFFFAAYGFIDILFSKERFRKLFPVLLVCFFHLLISAAWPVMKFRYIVPLLPFVFLLSLEHIQHINVTTKLKHSIIAATFAFVILFSFLTYRAIPTHTYYYDGAITQDAFHGNEELQYLHTHGVR